MKHATLLLVGLAACTDHQPPITGTASLQIKLVTPADPGSVANRIPDTARSLSVDIQAFDENNQPDTGYAKTLQVYAHFLGTLTPYLGGAPLKTIQMAGGVAKNQALMLPPVFGPTTVWFDDGSDTDPTYATGVSPTLWFRDPFIADIETPTNETAIDALTNSPLDAKNVSVDASRYGARGRLVVTSVFAQGYTLADVQCADANGTPPCVAGDYDFLEIFSYSAAQDQNHCYLTEGQIIAGFAGGVSDFDGLTEISFPQTFVNETTPAGGMTGSNANIGNCSAAVIDTRVEPAPAKLDATWFTNKIMFERNEGGAIEIDGGKVCPLDADYTTYKQWKIDPSGAGTPSACAGNNVLNVITAGVIELDPATLVGKTVPKLVGMLRPINIGTFNVWIVYPRSSADLTLQ